MGPSADWCPMRWPEGDYWRNSASLDLLRGTPVNCLILPWASEPEQNGKWNPLIEAGREAGLSLVGWLVGGTRPREAVAQAAASGLSAVAMPDPPDLHTLPLIPVAERAKLPWRARSPILATGDGVWPSVRAGRSGDDTADAGPTGFPWIDSNAWLVRLARALAPDKTLWFALEPPERPAADNAHRCLLAIADAQTYGARWVVSLGATLSGSLASGNAPAQRMWRRIAGGLGFHERHKEWRGYAPAGVLAVVSDFSGDNEYLAAESLNLLGRRQLPYRVVPKAAAGESPLDEFKAILYPDAQEPEGGLRERVLDFVRAGGLLIGQPALRGLAAGGRRADSASPRFDVSVVGRGRIAAAREEISDPWLLAADSHLLLGRRHDLFRLWNSGAISTDYRISRDQRRAVLQIVSYAAGPAEFLSVRFERLYKRGRLWTLEREAAVDVPALIEGNRAEFHLPAFSIYAALELEA